VTTEMRRCRPRKLRGRPYADRLWVRQVLRSWLRWLGGGHADLDALYNATMMDDRR